jgi:hypothetical protein
MLISKARHARAVLVAFGRRGRLVVEAGVERPSNDHRPQQSVDQRLPSHDSWRPARGRVNPGLTHDLPDGRCGHRDPEGE